MYDVSRRYLDPDLSPAILAARMGWSRFIGVVFAPVAIVSAKQDIDYTSDTTNQPWLRLLANSIYIKVGINKKTVPFGESLELAS